MIISCDDLVNRISFSADLSLYSGIFPRSVFRIAVTTPVLYFVNVLYRQEACCCSSASFFSQSVSAMVQWW